MDSPTSVQIPEILRLEERRNFIFGTWNVKSFKKENEKKILDELEHFNVDIACLQETRCQEDILEKREYKVVMKCYNKDMKFGLGFIIKKDLYQYTHFESNPTERICSLKLRTNAGNIHIINVYVPHTNNDSEMIEECFVTLAKKLSKISEDEIVFLLGDFNSRVGSDNVVWSVCLGENGISYKVSNNGRRLLEFCTFHDLCITHSFFDQKGNAHYTFLNNSSPKISNKLSPQSSSKSSKLSNKSSSKSSSKLTLKPSSKSSRKSSPKSSNKSSTKLSIPKLSSKSPLMSSSMSSPKTFSKSSPKSSSKSSSTSSSKPSSKTSIKSSLIKTSPKSTSKPFPKTSYIDFCITRNKHRHCVKMTKSNFPKKSSTEKFVIGDHLLVTSNIELTFNHPNQTKSLSKSQHMLLVSFIIVLRNQRTTKKPDVDVIENQWKQISDIIFTTSNKVFVKHSKDQFCKFEKYLKEMNDFIDSLPEINKGSGINELTDEKVKHFDVFFKNILILFTWLDEQKSMEEDIKKINITKETITELLNSGIIGYGSGSNSNNFVNCKYSAFLNLPSIDEIDKSFKIHKFEEILKQAKMNKLDEILKQTYKLYELCWQYQYSPMELVYASIAYVYNRLDTCTDGFNNYIYVIYTLGKCFAEIIGFRINQLRVETDKDRCVQGIPNKTTLLIKLCQQQNKESQTCFQGFFSVLDDLENDNKIFFNYLSSINTPFEIRKRFSSVIGYLRCWKCLNAEKYFCHRDTQTDGCLIDVILSELTWSVINTNLKTKRNRPEFSDEILCLASYLNSAVIQTNSLEILKEYISHLAFDCEKIGLKMCTTKILTTHNVKNEDVVDIMLNEQLTLSFEVNFLDVIFSRETKKNYYINVLHNISKACVAMSEMLKTIPSGTKPTYDKMIVQYDKSVSNVLTSNCDIYKKYFSRPRKQLLEAFDIKCKKKIEEACDIFTPTVNQKIFNESQKSKKRVSSCVPDRIPIKKSKTSVPRKNKPSIINNLRKKYQKMFHKIRRN